MYAFSCVSTVYSAVDTCGILFLLVYHLEAQFFIVLAQRYDPLKILKNFHSSFEHWVYLLAFLSLLWIWVLTNKLGWMSLSSALLRRKMLFLLSGFQNMSLQMELHTVENPHLRVLAALQIQSLSLFVSDTNTTTCPSAEVLDSSALFFLPAVNYKQQLYPWAITCTCQCTPTIPLLCCHWRPTA